MPRTPRPSGHRRHPAGTADPPRPPLPAAPRAGAGTITLPDGQVHRRAATSRPRPGGRRESRTDCLRRRVRRHDRQPHQPEPGRTAARRPAARGHRLARAGPSQRGVRRATARASRAAGRPDRIRRGQAGRRRRHHLRQAQRARRRSSSAPPVAGSRSSGPTPRRSPSQPATPGPTRSRGRRSAASSRPKSSPRPRSHSCSRPPGRTSIAERPWRRHSPGPNKPPPATRLTRRPRQPREGCRRTAQRQRRPAEPSSGCDSTHTVEPLGGRHLAHRTRTRTVTTR